MTLITEKNLLYNLRNPIPPFEETDSPSTYNQSVPQDAITYCLPPNHKSNFKYHAKKLPGDALSYLSSAMKSAGSKCKKFNLLQTMKSHKITSCVLIGGFIGLGVGANFGIGNLGFALVIKAIEGTLTAGISNFEIGSFLAVIVISLLVGSTAGAVGGATPAVISKAGNISKKEVPFKALIALSIIASAMSASINTGGVLLTMAVGGLAACYVLILLAFGFGGLPVGM